ncbi:MAG: lactate utilization protein [Pirellulales bacterium]|nr:lactate utilization protein [Pirellulales bacterium]
MNRDEFFQRVRQATQSGSRFHVATRGDIPASIGYVGGGDDRVASFVREATAVGGTAVAVDDWIAARHQVQEWIERHGARHALCWQHPVLEQFGWQDLAAELGLTVADYAALAEIQPSAAKAAMLAADVGVTSCECAVAETGSLVMLARPGHERLASLAPKVHIAIVAESQIVADLFDVFTRLEAAGLDRLPSNVTLITGPSKTGDLELKLTTGVHGPGFWYVVVVRGV